MGIFSGGLGAIVGGAAAFFTGGTSAAILAGIGVGAQVGGALDARSAQKEQANIQRQQAAQMARQAELERRKADIANMRMLRASIRSARLARGALINVGAQTGTSGSSGVLGGLASIGTQEGVNRGVFTQGQDLSERQYQTQVEMSQLHSAYGSAAARAATGQFVGKLGDVAFGMGGGYKTLFGV